MTAAISVVIPARDGERYLAEAVRSARDQERASVEVIVVDDGSADRTAAVAEQAGARVLRRPPRGAASARNAGVAAASGALLAFLDADDRLVPGSLAMRAVALAQDPGLDGVIGSVRSFITPDRAAELEGRVACPAEPQVGATPSALLIRREAFVRSGGFDEELAAAEGVEWFHRVRASGMRIAYLPEVVLERRIHGANMTLVDPAVHRAYLQVARAAVLRRRAEDAPKRDSG